MPITGIFFFPHIVLNLFPQRSFNFQVSFSLPSANALNLDRPKTLSFGKEVNPFQSDGRKECFFFFSDSTGQDQIAHKIQFNPERMSSTCLSDDKILALSKLSLHRRQFHWPSNGAIFL